MSQDVDSDGLKPIDPKRFSTLYRVIRDEKHSVVVTFGGGAVPGMAGNLALAYLLSSVSRK